MRPEKVCGCRGDCQRAAYCAYVIPPDYMGDAVTITMDAVAAATAPEITEEMYEQLDYLEKHPEENYYENEENFSQYDQGD